MLPQMEYIRERWSNDIIPSYKYVERTSDAMGTNIRIRIIFEYCALDKYSCHHRICLTQQVSCLIWVYRVHSAEFALGRLRAVH